MAHSASVAEPPAESAPGQPEATAEASAVEEPAVAELAPETPASTSESGGQPGRKQFDSVDEILAYCRQVDSE